MKKNRNISTKSIARIALMTAITVGLSFVRIPFMYVPFTLQTLSCMIAGLMLARREAVLSQIIYVVLGLLGLPIFTAGGGPAYVIYPTFGYILFMPVMTYIISTLKNKNIILSLVAGFIPQLFFGAMYYFFIVTVMQGVEKELGAILIALFISFIPVEALKALSAYLLYQYLPNSLKNKINLV